VTVNTTANRTSYAGNGSTQVFTFPYYFLADSDLTVILRVDSTGVETVQALTTDYTVSGAGNEAGGTVTMLTAPATGETLVILRTVQATQPTDFVENDALPAETLEETVDRLAMAIQTAQEVANRAIVVPRTDSSSLSVELPSSVSRASKYFGFNSDGEPAALDAPTVDSASLVVVSATAPDHANGLTWIDSGVAGTLTIKISDGTDWTTIGSVDTATNTFSASASVVTATGATEARTLADRFADVYNVKDYGAEGDGSTDDTAAIQAAIDDAEAGRGGIVFFPPGNYRINSQITIDGDSITLQGSGFGTSTGTGATVLDLRYTTAAQILIGNASTRRNGIRFCDMHIYAGSATSLTQPTFESRYVRDLFFERLTYSGLYTFLQAGRSGEATTYIWMDKLEGNMRAAHSHFLSLINVPGGLTISDCHIEGTATIVSGACAISHVTAAFDGGNITNSVFGLFDRHLNLRARTANLYISNTILDRFGVFGVFMEAAASETIHSVIIDGCHFAAEDETAVNRAVFVQENGGELRSITISDNKIASIGAEGIWVTGALEEIVISGNNIRSTGRATNNTYAAIRVGTSADKVLIAGNLIAGASSGNQPENGVSLESTGQDIVVADNLIYNTASAAIASNNTAQNSRARYWIGPFTLANVAASQADLPMHLPTVTSAAAVAAGIGQVPMPRRGRISGISVASAEARTAGTLTVKAGVNATAGTLTAVLNATNTQFVTATRDSGDTFNAGDKISPRVTTDASWAPTTADICVWLEVTET